MLKKLIALNKSDFWLLWGVVGGVFLVAQLVEGIVLASIKSDSAILISGALLPGTAGLFLVFTTVAQITVTFEQAVRFGCTRRRALGLSLGLSAAEIAGAMGLAAVLTLAERAACPQLWRMLTGMDSVTIAGEGRQIPEYMAGVQVAERSLHVVDVTLAWYWWIAIALAALGLGLIAGAVLQRFGRKGFWALWVMWMAGCFVPQLLPGEYHAIVRLLPTIGLGIGAAALVGLAWSVWSLLHMAVRN